MPRKLRLEFPGACYHVINRGNYRADVFATEGAKSAFEACLFEACEKSAWKLHAFVIMTNHYHLALETPDGNLVAGMQWLQATFANRFNQVRGSVATSSRADTRRCWWKTADRWAKSATISISIP
ncbi:MAG: transposase [Opitutaceae bacterium]|nr:transposase [Opitutaceae bacterium]